MNKEEIEKDTMTCPTSQRSQALHCFSRPKVGQIIEFKILHVGISVV